MYSCFDASKLSKHTAKRLASQSTFNSARKCGPSTQVSFPPVQYMCYFTAEVMTDIDVLVPLSKLEIEMF